MDPKTEQIIALFEQVSAVPRSSGHEEKIRAWLQAWAAGHGYKNEADEAGNLLVRVPATPGYEDAPGVILQGHLDMVCEKTPESHHDFTKDPIRFVYDGDWLKADGTTLGADNGIGVAFMLAISEDSLVQHPSLELLFTVEEEVGIGGAAALQPGWLQGRRLINLDSEEEGIFIVGCAGGRKTEIKIPFTLEPVPSNWQAFRLSIRGLQGGHSGVDIHKHRASANQLLGRVLWAVNLAGSLRLLKMRGGTAHNAIAREAEAVLACDPGLFPALQTAIAELEDSLADEFKASETGLGLKLAPTGATKQALSTADSCRCIDLLLALPHGVSDFSASVEGFVETSNNLARVELKENELYIITSQRSSVMSRLDQITNRIEAIGRLSGAEVSSSDGYPAWQPNPQSALVEYCQATYQRSFGTKAQIKMIHGGLECGIIGSKFPGLDMISIGATLQNAHSPNERLEITSTAKVWKLLVEALAGLN